MPVELKESGGSVLLPVKALAGARKNELRGIHEGRLKVCVTQVAEKGKANKAIIKLLAKSFGVAKSQVELVSGELNARKMFAITGLTIAEIRKRLPH